MIDRSARHLGATPALPEATRWAALVALGLRARTGNASSPATVLGT
jgi:hypothetical protein